MFAEELFSISSRARAVTIKADKVVFDQTKKVKYYK